LPKVSRKRFQEALRCLKQACRHDKLSFPLRIRAAELILAIYGVPLPESAARIKRSVKELVQEGSFDKEVREQVNEKVRQDAEAQARAFLGRVKNAPIEEKVEHTNN
jgi:hypothetical protein